MPADRRSPWSGLTSSQALELADALTAPVGRPHTTRPRAEHDAWTVHVEYARRAAAALVGNDLREALRAAEIAAVALRLSQVPAYVPRKTQRSVDQHPATDRRPEPATTSRPAHVGQAHEHALLVAVTS